MAAITQDNLLEELSKLNVANNSAMQQALHSMESSSSLWGDEMAKWTLCLLVIGTLWIGSGYSSSFLHKTLRKTQLDETVSDFICNALRYSVFYFASTACLTNFGVKIPQTWVYARWLQL
eukprot:gb/GEZN01016002.1/.p1 GENE.gb/GEZN01016002.1/~~gb/GEZN01016002.1/.p1  ORF type:complete len:120 (-),score=17.14 gb/GEZN01016002.1/:285-644(-)